MIRGPTVPSSMRISVRRRQLLLRRQGLLLLLRSRVAKPVIVVLL